MVCRAFGLLIVLCLGFVLTSCGGGGSAATPQPGQLMLQVGWPARSRYVPTYAESICAKLTVNSEVFTLIMNRVGNQGHMQAGVFNEPIPAGTYDLEIDAYTQNGAYGQAVAAGNLQVTITAGQVTIRDISADLDSTIDHLVIDNQPISVTVGQQIQLTGHAEDASNAALLLPPGALTWSITAGSNRATVTGLGLLTGVQGGQATVQLAELGAGKSVTAPVTVVELPENERIAFVDNRDGNHEIYSMLPDGSGVTRLTTEINDQDVHPAWSPTRQQIAFASTRNTAQLEIYAMNADGSNVVRLTTDPNIDTHPSWSPDGTKIVFSSDRAGGNNFELYVMDANGGNVTRLTFTLGSNEVNPSWSPDGTRITFARDVGADFDVFVINSDGSNEVNLTNSAAEDFSPRWSPDGSEIVFASDMTGNFCIFKVAATGGAPQQLTPTGPGAFDKSPAFSPDGTRICFASNRSGGEAIYMMKADGSNLAPVLPVGIATSVPTWSR